MSMHLTVEVPAPGGDLKVVWTDAKHAHVSCDEYTVKGGTYRVDAHVHNYNGKGWTFRASDGATYGRVLRLGMMMGDAPPTHSAKALSEVMEAVSGFAEDNPGTLREAEDKRRAWSMESLDRQRAGLMEAVRAIDRERRACKSGRPFTEYPLNHDGRPQPDAEMFKH